MKVNKPQAFARTGVLALAPQAFMLDLAFMAPLVYETPFVEESGVAIVEIRGVLTHHADNPACDNYDSIRERMRAALHSECSAVIMRIDSLGGDVAGCFDLAHYIHHEAREHGKRLYAYTEGHMASAAYALGCVADTIGVGLTGFCGSIGIINAFTDQTARDAAEGLRFGFATSGARKADGNPHIGITDDAMTALQGQVDALADVFYRHVADHRPLSLKAISDLEAGLFFGTGAVALKLADRVCSWGEMVSLAANSPTQQVANMPKYLEEARKMAAKMVQDGDEHDRKMAQKMMALFDAPADKEDKKDEAKAEEDKPKEEAKAEADEPKKEEDKAKAKAEGEEGPDSEKMRAAAAANPSVMLELLQEVHSLKAGMAAKEIAAERAQLLASRPDFDAKTRGWLASAPIEQVRQAVANFPRITVNPAAASQVVGTIGESQMALDSGASTEDRAFIAKAMGRAKPISGVHTTGRLRNELSFHWMDQAEAQARLAELEKGAK